MSKTDSSVPICALNGQLVDEKTLLNLVYGPAVELGWTAFETMRTVSGMVLGLDEHLERLRASAVAMDIPYAGTQVLFDEITGLIPNRTDTEWKIRLTLGQGGHRSLTIAPLQPPPEMFSVALRPWMPMAGLPGWVKHGCRAGWNLAVRRSGADEVVWVDPQGELLEGTRSNLFVVQDGHLRTPPTDGRILPGVTRAKLLEVARAAGMRIDVGPVRVDDGWTALYLCSTLKNLVPVQRVDEQTLPGWEPLGRAMSSLFQQRFLQHCQGFGDQ